MKATPDESLNEKHPYILETIEERLKVASFESKGFASELFRSWIYSGFHAER